MTSWNPNEDTKSEVNIQTSNQEKDEEILETARKIKTAKSKIKKALSVLVIGLICFGLGALIFGRGNGFGGEELEAPDDGKVSVSTIQTIIKPASDLITGKYFYTNAVSDEDPISIGDINLPGTTNKYVFTYDGTISAGYDMSEIKVGKVDYKNKIIRLLMPELKILASEVDENSFKIKYKSTSIFNDKDLERNSKTRAACEKRMINKAKKNPDFIKMVKNNAEVTIRAFLTSSKETKDYTVKFKYVDEEK